MILAASSAAAVAAAAAANAAANNSESLSRGFTIFGGIVTALCLIMAGVIVWDVLKR